MSGNIPDYDPYLIWDFKEQKSWTTRAEECKWVGLLGKEKKKFLRELQEFSMGQIYIPPTHLEDQGPGETFFTATLNADLLRSQLSSESTNYALDKLLKACESSFASDPYTAFKLSANKAGGKVCGVIDFGCAYLHPEFQENNPGKKTRIHSIWDQGATKEWNGEEAGWLNCHMGYGSVLSEMHINTALNTNPTAYGNNGSNYLRDPNTGSIYSKTHGTHVLGLAAGLTSPFQPSDTLLEVPAAGDKEEYPEVIFVQLPLDKYKSTQRGSLGRFILDGVRYILDNCEAEANIVINISYGSTTGPHDGSSMLERALDHLIDKHNGKLSIVLSAGNSHLEDCHLTTKVAGGKARFEVQLPTKSASETLVEFWYAKSAAKTIGVKAFESNEKPNDANPMRLTAGENGEVLGIRGGRIYHTKGSPNTNRNKVLVLLALPPVATADAERKVVIEFDGADAAKYIQGWIELDASVATREDNARFLNVPSSIKSVALGDTQQLDAEINENTWNTMSGFATGTNTYKCGARRFGQKTPLPYSSRKLLSKKLDPLFLLAAAEESATLSGILGPSVDPDTLWRMNGTSVSAAMCTRRLLQRKGEQQQQKQKALEDPWVDEIN